MERIINVSSLGLGVGSPFSLIMSLDLRARHVRNCYDVNKGIHLVLAHLGPSIRNTQQCFQCPKLYCFGLIMKKQGPASRDNMQGWREVVGQGRRPRKGKAARAQWSRKAVAVQSWLSGEMASAVFT